MAEAIRIEDLRKTFRIGFIPKTRPILKGITFSVREGEIFGYLGPNGAGKTTTIKCLLDLIHPDAGTIAIFGRPAASPRAREVLGFLPENPYFYDYLSAREFLAFTADLFGLGRAEKEERIARLLKLVGLARAADLPLRKYSRGMLQRAGLAQALINEPKLVVLDEPLGGMDPLGRKEIRDIIVRFRDEGKTVLFTSHILQDIEMICDRVAIIVGGRIVKEGGLRDLVSEKVLFTEVTVSGLPPQAFAGFGEGVTSRGDRVFLKVYDEARVDEIVGLVRDRKGRLVALSPRTETLEDIFVDTVTRT
ncbi:MAG TPA: ABC transporter ATP-binding protein [Candidatus Aminicenantes bacterium]|nr:ABC transporter ATP-binding protein [Candidatus Aminicenantes bacterium]HRY64690.1 ABC transporter ATP-binding protein [Candidatus Aminicenantes bacterium]HRZ71603.1 ABC transporter ATP-binding protein [Candidatus Aminicenantes bacterium]